MVLFSPLMESQVLSAVMWLGINPNIVRDDRVETDGTGPAITIEPLDCHLATGSETVPVHAEQISKIEIGRKALFFNIVLLSVKSCN